MRQMWQEHSWTISARTMLQVLLLVLQREMLLPGLCLSTKEKKGKGKKRKEIPVIRSEQNAENYDVTKVYHSVFTGNSKPKMFPPA